MGCDAMTHGWAVVHINSAIQLGSLGWGSHALPNDLVIVLDEQCDLQYDLKLVLQGW